MRHGAFYKKAHDSEGDLVADDFFQMISTSPYAGLIQEMKKTADSQSNTLW